MAAAPQSIVVMGVCGSGKSLLAAQLAQALGAQFIEGDEHHPPRNVQRMAAGLALDDADRWPWLDALAAALARARHEGQGAVLACSALKRAYRDRLRRGGAPDLRLIHLDGAPELLAERLTARRDHYMPPSLLASQLATLEVPAADEGALRLDAAQDPQTLLQAALASLQPRTAP
jgi:gluconokinase